MTEDNNKTTASSISAKALATFEAALEQPSDLQEDYIRRQCGDDDVLYKEVMRLFELDSKNANLIKTGNALLDKEDDKNILETVGSYKITSLIGKGGMGAVYLGERFKDDFEHKVAIKIIRTGILSEKLIERFNHERQILAKFSHAHIARLFDGGTTDDGSPYIIMEYIDGKPITKWAEVQQLPLQDRIHLLQKACHAVAYAHQNLIVHRDITPSNILINNEGQVKLIDFGIAKPVDENIDQIPQQSSLNSLSFTPGYAAPERINSGMANTLSDVFSLGKLLEELCHGAKASINSELKAIIKKATSENPKDRYQSVDFLNADLNNYKEGKSVEAMNGSQFYHFKKFVNRQKFPLAAIGFVFFASIATSFVMFSLYSEAKTQRQRAEARFEDARALSHKILTQSYDSFVNIKGTLEARKKLADILREYVDQLASDPYAPENIQFDVGTSYMRLSDIYGGIGLPNLGDGETSHALLQKAVEKLQHVSDLQPDNGEILSELMTAKRFIVHSYLSYGKNAELALKTNDEVLGQTQWGGKQDWPQARKIRRTFWSARTDRIRVLLIENRQEEALELTRKWQKEFTPEVENSIDNPERIKAFLALREGEILKRSGRADQAIEPLKTALSVYQKLSAENPDSFNMAFVASGLLNEIAGIYTKGDDGENALKYAYLTVKTSEDLLKFENNDRNSQSHVAQSLLQVGQAETRFGDWDKGVAAIMRAISIHKDVITNSKDNDQSLNNLLFAYINLAQAHLIKENFPQACDALVLTHNAMNDAREFNLLRKFNEDTISQRIQSALQSAPPCQGIPILQEYKN